MNSHHREPDLFVTAAGPTLYCEVAQQLLEAFSAAVQELVKLHEQQFLDVLARGTSAPHFDLLIREANEGKQQAKYAYLAHLEVHGCSVNNDGTGSSGT